MKYFVCLVWLGEGWSETPEPAIYRDKAAALAAPDRVSDVRGIELEPYDSEETRRTDRPA